MKSIKTKIVKCWTIKEFVAECVAAFGDDIFNWVGMNELYTPSLNFVVRDPGRWVYSKKQMSNQDVREWLETDTPRVDILLHVLVERKIIPQGKYILT